MKLFYVKLHEHSLFDEVILQKIHGATRFTIFRLSHETDRVHLNATAHAQKPDFVFRAKRTESI